MSQESPIQVPALVVAVDQADLGAPTTGLLQELHLLSKDEELKEASGLRAVFLGPPDSVAVLQAGGTALSKWWAAGGAATVAAAWGALAAFNDDLQAEHRGTFLVAVAVVTAAAVLSIGYIVGSDVRGRAAASVATMEGRALVARAIIEAAVATRADPQHEVAGQIVSLPSPLNIRYLPARGDDELGWTAVALRVTDKNEYLLIKAGTQLWAGEADVELT